MVANETGRKRFRSLTVLSFYTNTEGHEIKIRLIDTITFNYFALIFVFSSTFNIIISFLSSIGFSYVPWNWSETFFSMPKYNNI